MLNPNCCENGVAIGKFIPPGEKFVLVWPGTGDCCVQPSPWNPGGNSEPCEPGTVPFWLDLSEIKQKNKLIITCNFNSNFRMN